MTDAPERINILTEFAKDLPTEKPRYGHSTEYIRADALEDLQRENAKLRDVVTELLDLHNAHHNNPAHVRARGIIQELGKGGQSRG